jgi:hypothetical protein
MKINVTSNQTMLVLLPASAIPDGATVQKRTGEKIYTLKQSLKVYLLENREPMNIDGCFLCYDGAHNQIKSDTLLHWRIDAQSLLYILASSLEENYK